MEAAHRLVVHAPDGVCCSKRVTPMASTDRPRFLSDSRSLRCRPRHERSALEGAVAGIGVDERGAAAGRSDVAGSGGARQRAHRRRVRGGGGAAHPTRQRLRTAGAERWPPRGCLVEITDAPSGSTACPERRVRRGCRRPDRRPRQSSAQPRHRRWGSGGGAPCRAPLRQRGGKPGGQRGA